MSNTQTAKTVPAYRIYSVAKKADDKAIWQEIGVAWAHKDGKGLHLQFNARPLEGAEVELRLPTAKEEPEA